MELVKSYTDVVVIGCGVSGMTAALYLKRSNVDVVIIENNAPGGQINSTAKIENYPGILSIKGPELAIKMFNQISEIGVLYKQGKVIEVSDDSKYKIVKMNNEVIKCKSVIISTGRKPRLLNVKGEKELMGKGISWCAICDGPFFKGEDVAVIGAGNSALEEALFLSEFVNKVYIINRKSTFKADKKVVDEVLLNSKIEVIYNSSVKSFDEENKKLVSITLNDDNKVFVKGAFIFIGFEPVSGFVSKYNLTDQSGYIEVDSNMRTKTRNIYACGDVIKKELYQIATSVGEGAIAAISAVKDLEQKK